jgi:thiol:disulfide interchange protein DsbC
MILAGGKMRLVLRALVGVLVLFASPLGADEIDSLRRTLRASMPDVQIGEIRRTPWGMYEVVANGINVFYTDARGEVGLFGRAIELKTRADLSQRRLAELRRVDFAHLPFDKAIVRVRGKGTRKLVLFADPDCPYCREIEPELARLDDVTIYTFLLPLPSIHPDAMRKATLIWCAPDRAKAWDDWMLRGKLPDGGDLGCATPILELTELAKRLNIVGTPGFIFADGELVPGTLSREQLEARLGAARHGS